MALATAGHGCGAVEPLLGIICTANSEIVQIADVVRVLLMGAALCVAALAWRAWRADVDPGLYPGFRDRLGAIMTGCAFVAVTEYDRLGDPVTLRLALGMLAIVWAVRGLLRRNPGTEYRTSRLDELE